MGVVMPSSESQAIIETIKGSVLSYEEVCKKLEALLSNKSSLQRNLNSLLSDPEYQNLPHVLSFITNKAQDSTQNYSHDLFSQNGFQSFARIMVLNPRCLHEMSVQKHLGWAGTIMRGPSGFSRDDRFTKVLDAFCKDAVSQDEIENLAYGLVEELSLGEIATILETFETKPVRSTSESYENFENFRNALREVLVKKFVQINLYKYNSEPDKLIEILGNLETAAQNKRVLWFFEAVMQNLKSYLPQTDDDNSEEKENSNEFIEPDVEQFIENFNHSGIYHFLKGQDEILSSAAYAELAVIVQGEEQDIDNYIKAIFGSENTDPYKASKLFILFEGKKTKRERIVSSISSYDDKDEVKKHFLRTFLNFVKNSPENNEFESASDYVVSILKTLSSGEEIVNFLKELKSNQAFSQLSFIEKIFSHFKNNDILIQYLHSYEALENTSSEEYVDLLGRHEVEPVSVRSSLLGESNVDLSKRESLLAKHANVLTQDLTLDALISEILESEGDRKKLTIALLLGRIDPRDPNAIWARRDTLETLFSEDRKVYGSLVLKYIFNHVKENSYRCRWVQDFLEKMFPDSEAQELDLSFLEALDSDERVLLFKMACNPDTNCKNEVREKLLQWFIEDGFGEGYQFPITVNDLFRILTWIWNNSPSVDEQQKAKLDQISYVIYEELNARKGNGEEVSDVSVVFAVLNSRQCSLEELSLCCRWLTAYYFPLAQEVIKQGSKEKAWGQIYFIQKAINVLSVLPIEKQILFAQMNVIWKKYIPLVLEFAECYLSEVSIDLYKELCGGFEEKLVQYAENVLQVQKLPKQPVHLQEVTLDDAEISADEIAGKLLESFEVKPLLSGDFAAITQSPIHLVKVIGKGYYLLGNTPVQGNPFVAQFNRDGTITYVGNPKPTQAEQEIINSCAAEDFRVALIHGTLTQAVVADKIAQGFYERRLFENAPINFLAFKNMQHDNWDDKTAQFYLNVVLKQKHNILEMLRNDSKRPLLEKLRKNIFDRYIRKIIDEQQGILVRVINIPEEEVSNRVSGDIEFLEMILSSPESIQSKWLNGSSMRQGFEILGTLKNHRDENLSKKGYIQEAFKAFLRNVQGLEVRDKIEVITDVFDVEAMDGWLAGMNFEDQEFNKLLLKSQLLRTKFRKLYQERDLSGKLEAFEFSSKDIDSLIKELEEQKKIYLEDSDNYSVEDEDVQAIEKLTEYLKEYSCKHFLPEFSEGGIREFFYNKEGKFLFKQISVRDENRHLIIHNAINHGSDLTEGIYVKLCNDYLSAVYYKNDNEAWEALEERIKQLENQSQSHLLVQCLLSPGHFDKLCQSDSEQAKNIIQHLFNKHKDLIMLKWASQRRFADIKKLVEKVGETELDERNKKIYEHVLFEDQERTEEDKKSWSYISKRVDLYKGNKSWFSRFLIKINCYFDFKEEKLPESPYFHAKADGDSFSVQFQVVEREQIDFSADESAAVAISPRSKSRSKTLPSKIQDVVAVTAGNGVLEGAACRNGEFSPKASSGASRHNRAGSPAGVDGITDNSADAKPKAKGENPGLSLTRRKSATWGPGLYTTQAAKRAQTLADSLPPVDSAYSANLDSSRP